MVDELNHAARVNVVSSANVSATARPRCRIDVRGDDEQQRAGGR